MTVVLMYHALYRDGDTSEIDSEDMPYAVSESDFSAQLDRLCNRSVGLLENGKAPDIVLTFDDGHRSNLTIAAPLLCERGFNAYFFITSGFIGKRPGFMSPEELKRLSDEPGMVIGSHGVTHRFFDDLSDTEAWQELVESQQSVEQLTGKPCQSMSFPGGRYNNDTLSKMKQAGYTQWFGSEVDIVDTRRLVASDTNVSGSSLSAMQNTVPVQRVAIRRGTPLAEFDRMITPDKHYYLSHKRRGAAKAVIRRILGNRLYHGLYKSFSAR